MSTARVILHLDMDAFFASVEQLDNPELRGKPVVVGAAPGRRGVVATASYEARVFGIRSAMPSATAFRLCPEAIFVPVRGERYAEVSGRIMEVLHDFTPFVEQVSVDEAFLDCTGVLRVWKDPPTLARALKDRVRQETGLTASVGVASNKFLAKLASDLQKPDGLTVVPGEPARIRELLAPLEIRRIWGVGPKTAAVLQQRGLRTIGDVQARTIAELTRWVGPAFANHLHRLSHGLDDRPLELEREEKSISHEHTFDVDCRDAATARATLLTLAEGAGRRLRRSGAYAATACLKVRDPAFRTFTRQMPMEPPACTDRRLRECALELWAACGAPLPVRLLGFGVSNLRDSAQPDTQPALFPDWDAPPGDARHERLDAAVDAIRERFGRDALRRPEPGHGGGNGP